ncbi:MAG: molecular chaperone DnaK [Candidatus Doudnabacteria bacterium RIFCSPHIGHO2_02_FULL_48_21]|nr:MAG: molecular chaperone DnaK [Candidatus Doudnabacteria bacterium RIFCSPHIGHO2_01_48_18]OGE77452.1 MAG: molecular chaperone DnaK [Candidatus Doudnabacteria bacterium RIFCSPHIGHO2_01_FULL_48_180]OGE91569.1 MAG: molecular chaperone DnaK [Candidatus Doudnabacteria bacterium RIFCSPHIGHO2_12_FULL_47_25]OGE93159.1 MAG: molecular chaperone DnaK [Candidatus Doudnabacteria bacterium RIFCSPHIGHO2_02_FULL_48_21]OGE97243.1 MAG: molecular chaperone DnaK [Candidatus Doudnabacteria bacterium RIFCSPLOWO2_0
MPKIIGIDLGTSNSAASVLEGGKPVMIPSAEGTTVGGGKAFPSYVAMTKDSELLVGEPARRQAVTNPEGTVYAVKRKMGTKEKVKMLDKEYTPEQISAFILQKIKKDAESYLGGTVTKAVVTVPAYFDDSQRQATKNAGEIAGLEIVRIINEPTAAALAYGLDKADHEQKILVFDLGGGTLDVTIMDFGQGVFEVVSTSGDTKLGGTDMDNQIMDYVAEEFKNQSGIDIRNDKMAYNRLKESAEKAKIELSTTLETEINLPFITADASGPKHLSLKITRAKLEELVRTIVERTRVSLEQSLTDAKLAPKDIDKIIMVGGPTRMPIVQKFVEEYIGKPVERGVDPMEAVAKGAAVQAGVLGGEVKDVLLLDVTPLTLGIETLGGVSTPLIERNTTIPTSKSQVFSTAADNQTSVEIHILQGERPMAADNKSLGRFILDGLPPSPRGVPQVEVIFDIDANGILKVTAKDKATSKEQHITISGSSNLSKDEIERMRKEAEAHAEEDRRRKELVDARNQADQLAAVAEKTLKDGGDKIEAGLKTSLEAKVAELKKIKEGSDADAIKKQMEAISQEIQKVGAAMYSQKPPEGQTEAKTDEPKDDKDKAQDAEFEEKK